MRRTIEDKHTTKKINPEITQEQKYRGRTTQEITGGQENRPHATHTGPKLHVGRTRGRGRASQPASTPPPRQTPAAGDAQTRISPHLGSGSGGDQGGHETRRTRERSQYDKINGFRQPLAARTRQTLILELLVKR